MSERKTETPTGNVGSEAPACVQHRSLFLEIRTVPAGPDVVQLLLPMVGVSAVDWAAGTSDEWLALGRRRNADGVLDLMAPRAIKNDPLKISADIEPMNTSAFPSQVGDHALVLFDGVCNLCNGAVNFIIDRDPDGYFRFAPLQSDTAERVLADREAADASLSTIVLVEEGEVFVRSTAALRIARHLSGGWPLLYAAMVVPRPIRDAVYDWIAHHRYDWFGRRDQCRVPTPALKDRFLEYEPH
jgi:predicted DCC family thiol-disulfide oxidoreductase YuxK